MYIPAAFKLSDLAALHHHIEQHPFATLVTFSAEHGLQASHLPLSLHRQQGPYGTLVGHLAHKNPLWQQHDSSQPVLAIFHGPHSYISPGWYPTKKQNGKAVPTWNYTAVHAYGHMHTTTDRAELKADLTQLSDQHEQAMPNPWHLHDAPEPYINAMLNAIVGIRIEITQLQGKNKLSQNQPSENQQGVIENLRAHALPNTPAQEVADLMEQQLRAK